MCQLEAKGLVERRRGEDGEVMTRVPKGHKVAQTIWLAVIGEGIDAWFAGQGGGVADSGSFDAGGWGLEEWDG